MKITVTTSIIIIVPPTTTLYTKTDLGWLRLVCDSKRVECRSTILVKNLGNVFVFETVASHFPPKTLDGPIKLAFPDYW